MPFLCRSKPSLGLTWVRMYYIAHFQIFGMYFQVCFSFNSHFHRLTNSSFLIAPIFMMWLQFSCHSEQFQMGFVWLLHTLDRYRLRRVYGDAFEAFHWIRSTLLKGCSSIIIYFICGSLPKWVGSDAHFWCNLIGSPHQFCHLPHGMRGSSLSQLVFSDFY